MAGGACATQRSSDDRNSYSSTWWPRNHGTMIPPAILEGCEGGWIWNHTLDLWMTKKCGNTLTSVGRRPPPHPKLTLSTTLAQAAEKVKQKFPPQYAKYAKVFDEPKDGKLPPWWSFDHTINFKDSFVPQVARTYPMNPKEMDAYREFIDEHLKSGKSHKSQLPQASSFFFVQKKDEGLCPCQDYWHLNEHTIRNAYPLPLISTLIDKLKGAKYFSKMDIQWGYNNTHIKEGDEWKALFITPYGLCEPTVMFFGQCNSLPTF